ncbi:hypothetical protein AB6A40_002124 [Gnathostoma spinigerum]|uniref:Uncharacterized protein n=1 Tax=Gnathostoma spinigerum TaxID=75299 RepID=A0ABD6E6V0_9BILA
MYFSHHYIVSQRGWFSGRILSNVRRTQALTNCMYLKFRSVRRWYEITQKRYIGDPRNFRWNNDMIRCRQCREKPARAKKTHKAEA